MAPANVRGGALGIAIMKRCGWPHGTAAQRRLHGGAMTTRSGMVTKNVTECVSTTRTYHDTYEHDWFRVRGPLQECSSNLSDVSGNPYYRTPPVCVPAVLGELAAWQHNTKYIYTHIFIYK